MDLTEVFGPGISLTSGAVSGGKANTIPMNLSGAPTFSESRAISSLIVFEAMTRSGPAASRILE